MYKLVWTYKISLLFQRKPAKNLQKTTLKHGPRRSLMKLKRWFECNQYRQDLTMVSKLKVVHHSLLHKITFFSSHLVEKGQSWRGNSICTWKCLVEVCSKLCYSTCGNKQCLSLGSEMEGIWRVQSSNLQFNSYSVKSEAIIRQVEKIVEPMLGGKLLR